MTPLTSKSDVAPGHLRDEREDRIIAGFAALAIGIHVIEAAFPSPIPGIKPGLANVITLIVCYRHGWQAAAWVTLLRVVAGSFIIGTFLSPTFMLSAAGASASLLSLALSFFFLKRFISPVGHAVLASQANIIGQLLVAYFVFVRHPALFKIAPILLSTALLFGLLSGIIAKRVIATLDARHALS